MKKKLLIILNILVNILVICCLHCSKKYIIVNRYIYINILIILILLALTIINKKILNNILSKIINFIIVFLLLVANFYINGLKYSFKPNSYEIIEEYKISDKQRIIAIKYDNFLFNNKYIWYEEKLPLGFICSTEVASLRDGDKFLYEDIHKSLIEKDYGFCKSEFKPIAELDGYEYVDHCKVRNKQ